MYCLSHLTKDFLRWAQYEKQKPYREQTLHTYAKCLRRLTRWLGDKDVRDITATDVSWVKRGLIDQGRRAGYINGHLWVMRAFLLFCKETLTLEVLEPKDIVISTPPAVAVEFLTPEQVARLLGSFNLKTITGVRQMAITAAILTSAMRISECLSLDRDSIVLKNGLKLDSVSTPSELKGGGVATIIGKGGRPRLVMFTAWGLRWIREYLSLRSDDVEPLFVTHWARLRTPERLPAEDFRKLLRKYSAVAGLTRVVTPHTLRRTAATTMRNNGGDTKDIQTLLGHASLSYTDRYLGVNYELVRAAQQRFLYYRGSERFNAQKMDLRVPWAPKAGHRRCKLCAKTDSEHRAFGLCSRCYQKKHSVTEPYLTNPENVAGRGFVSPQSKVWKKLGQDLATRVITKAN